LANRAVRILSKKVNLVKKQVDLDEKQGIFKKIVGELKGDKKVKRK
jgi:hypothetical protein